MMASGLITLMIRRSSLVFLYSSSHVTGVSCAPGACAGSISVLEIAVDIVVHGVPFVGCTDKSCIIESCTVVRTDDLRARELGTVGSFHYQLTEVKPPADDCSCSTR